ncbi:hypothetical protein CY652_19960 [Burkholderia sp. WAC0059]|uniref:hypothetical protein n=1 Tax=Burkholderia sp. WAC0059 TaxID=2066022 RepID=UPI000C7EF9A3|nr:hypothetical protein [Burkholderia sp. WAC0059]PLZ00734.1 hypothetical protein CY652_19960 [Burkholderia sp. WAC0059]
MNHRHIQTFLTVSAAFFALSAPLRSNAAGSEAVNAVSRCAQHAVTARADATRSSTGRVSGQS